MRSEAIERDLKRYDRVPDPNLPDNMADFVQKTQWL
jgi:hypothetical protein